MTSQTPLVAARHSGQPCGFPSSPAPAIAARARGRWYAPLLRTTFPPASSTPRVIRSQPRSTSKSPPGTPASDCDRVIHDQAKDRDRQQRTTREAVLPQRVVNRACDHVVQQIEQEMTHAPPLSRCTPLSTALMNSTPTSAAATGQRCTSSGPTSALSSWIKAPQDKGARSSRHPAPHRSAHVCDRGRRSPYRANRARCHSGI